MPDIQSRAPAILKCIEPLFTSDFHFLHKKILRLARRPFVSIEEHDEYLIDQANLAIQDAGPRAVLYCLGDFGMGSRSKLQEYLSRIRGQKVLIEGNHDDSGIKNLKGWQFVRQTYVKTFYGQRVFMCHYAMRCFEDQQHLAWNLHGDAHGELPDDPRYLSQDVGVDVRHLDGTRYRPFRFDELKAMMGAKLPTVRPGMRWGKT